MSSFTLYLIGLIVLTGGLSCGACELGVQPACIATGAVVLAGIGIITAVRKARQRDDSPANDA